MGAVGLRQRLPAGLRRRGCAVSLVFIGQRGTLSAAALYLMT